MNKKIKGLILLVVLAILGAIVVVAAGSAGATAVFKPYSTTVSWYKSGGTLTNVWPQNLTKISCGGIDQVDSYNITSLKMDQDYKALMAKAVLNSAADDAEFSPHDYSVTLLPKCENVSAVPSIPILSIGTCSGPGVVADYTLDAPVTKGIIYQIEGKTFTHVVVPNGNIITVNAIAAPGYYIPDSATKVFTWDTAKFGPDCGTVTPPPSLTGSVSTGDCTTGTIVTKSFTQAFVWNPTTFKWTPDTKAYITTSAKMPAAACPVVTPAVVAVKPVANTSVLASTGNATLLQVLIGGGLLLLGSLLVGLTHFRRTA